MNRDQWQAKICAWPLLVALIGFVVAVVMMCVRDDNDHSRYKLKDQCRYDSFGHGHERDRCKGEAAEEVEGIWYCLVHTHRVKTTLAAKEHGKSLAVRVTKGGEFLYLWSANPEKDNYPLDNLSIIHGVCGNRVWPNPIAKDKCVLYCKDCGLRLIIPSVVRTWKQLTAHFEEVLDD